MNCIAPSTLELYISNADDSDERRLLGNEPTYNHHASFSLEDQCITFKPGRNGDGNLVSRSPLPHFQKHTLSQNIYRVQPEESGPSKIFSTSLFESAASISPNVTKVAYVSTVNNSKANVWVLDPVTDRLFNRSNPD
jgi:Tol biopolymer transport system component